MNSMHKTGLQQHRRTQSLGGSSHAMKPEKDEDLALFHEMQEREMAEVTCSFLESGNKVVTEDIFSSTEWDKNDYGWLLSAPATTFIPNQEKGSIGNGYVLNGTTSAKSLLNASRRGMSSSEAPSKAEPASCFLHGTPATNKPANSIAALCSSTNSGPRKALCPSSNVTLRSTTPTPTGRPSTPKSQPAAARSSTPTRATGAPSVPNSGSSTTIARPSTPTGRSAILSSPRAAKSSKPSPVLSASTSVPLQPIRSSSTLASTVSSRPGGSSSRASTPVKRPATPTRTANSPSTITPSSVVNKRSASPQPKSANPPSTITHSSTVSKRSASPQPKSAISSRPSSPASRARQPAGHLAVLAGFSQEPPPNLRTSISERPLSNSRGSVASRASGTRPTQPAEINDGARRVRQSGSPLVTRGRLSSDSINSEKSLTGGKPHEAAPQTALSNGIPSKMIDRTGSAKKLLVLPEKQSALASPSAKTSAKPSPIRDLKSTTPSVRESTGFGRNLSKKSLDMALRHMDIGKNDPTSFKTFMSNMPTSSLYSVRSSKGRGRSSSLIADSPMATSSNASSENSMNFLIDREFGEGGDEMLSGRGSKASLINHPDSYYDEKKVNCWLGSPTAYHAAERNGDILQVFEQGIETLTASESLLVSHGESGLECDNFTLEPIQ